jgi:putative transposase
MEVSPSGYYAWRKRLTIAPKPRRKNLAQLVKNCYFENRRRYGVRRITASINKDGVKIGKFQVRRLMKEQSLVAIGPKRFVPTTTDSKGTAASPNLLKDIKIEGCAPKKIIIGDITYIPLSDGSWGYLAIWQDKVTRRIIGWSLSKTMTAALVISALQKAIRKGLVLAGAIIHSDRGSQYASNDFRELLRQSGFRQSMSGKGKGSR